MENNKYNFSSFIDLSDDALNVFKEGFPVLLVCLCQIIFLLFVKIFSFRSEMNKLIRNRVYVCHVASFIVVLFDVLISDMTDEAIRYVYKRYSDTDIMETIGPYLFVVFKRAVFFSTNYLTSYIVNEISYQFFVVFVSTLSVLIFNETKKIFITYSSKLEAIKSSYSLLLPLFVHLGLSLLYAGIKCYVDPAFSLAELAGIQGFWNIVIYSIRLFIRTRPKINYSLIFFVVREFIKSLRIWDHINTRNAIITLFIMFVLYAIWDVFTFILRSLIGGIYGYFNPRKKSNLFTEQKLNSYNNMNEIDRQALKKNRFLDGSLKVPNNLNLLNGRIFPHAR